MMQKNTKERNQGGPIIEGILCVWQKLKQIISAGIYPQSKPHSSSQIKFQLTLACNENFKKKNHKMIKIHAQG